LNLKSVRLTALGTHRGTDKKPKSVNIGGKECHSKERKRKKCRFEEKEPTRDWEEAKMGRGKITFGLSC
jgi:hypothetical protein